MKFKEWYGQYEEIKNNRLMGSFEYVENENDKSVLVNGLKRLGLNYEYAHDAQGLFIIYYREKTATIKLAINLYKKYIKYDIDTDAPGTYDGLTKDQHRFLGKIFGFTEQEIDWFMGEIDDCFD